MSPGVTIQFTARFSSPSSSQTGGIFSLGFWDDNSLSEKTVQVGIVANKFRYVLSNDFLTANSSEFVESDVISLIPGATYSYFFTQDSTGVSLSYFKEGDATWTSATFSSSVLPIVPSPQLYRPYRTVGAVLTNNVPNPSLNFAGEISALLLNNQKGTLPPTLTLDYFLPSSTLSIQEFEACLSFPPAPPPASPSPPPLPPPADPTFFEKYLLPIIGSLIGVVVIAIFTFFRGTVGSVALNFSDSVAAFFDVGELGDIGEEIGENAGDEVQGRLEDEFADDEYRT